MITSKNRILDAAEQIILRQGVSHLTIDAVAAEANLSKGGVLYHFPSKDDLIRGMIARLQEEFETQLQRFEQQDPCERGRRTRAYLHTIFPDQCSEACRRFDQLSSALLAAVANNPSLLEPVHTAGKALDDRMAEDGIDPAIAKIVSLAADGVWLASLFGMPSIEGKLRTAVRQKLEELTEIA